jgi:2-dehydro-3-deoxyphosphooctonate aldolase (KDO 8-P synthase)
MEKNRLLFIAGPCAIESREMSLKVANELKKICDKYDIDLIFKSSYDKANRTSIYSDRGVGIKEGLSILSEVRDKIGVKVITDVHESWQCDVVRKHVDFLQIPAFLCRQTDLLVAAAKTGLPINVKKGQFLSPGEMINVIRKLEESDAKEILVTERGTTFGYNNLVVDFTSFIELKRFNKRIVFDATHSVQKPGGQGDHTGGNREYVPYLIKAAVAMGVDAIFTEVHPDPDNAISDGPNQLKLSDFEHIVKETKEIFDLVNKQNE